VGRVAGEQDPAFDVAVGRELAAAPRHHPACRPLAAVVPHGPPHDRVDVELLGREALLRADEGQPPQRAAVDRRQVRPGSLRADEHVALGPAERMVVLQVLDLDHRAH
jgi:hypothetical protein